MGNVNLSNFRFEAGTYLGEKVIWVHFDYPKITIHSLRDLIKVNYSTTHKMWYIKDHVQNRKIVGLEVDLFPAVHALTESQQQAFSQFLQQIRLMAYSDKTIRTYGNELITFFKMFSKYNPAEITTELIRRYLLYCSQELKLSEFTINSRMNAIKFYYEKVLLQPRVVYEIPRPKRPEVLPKVLSINEVKNIFDAVQNTKHLMILKTIYGMGLRVSEVVNLKIGDLDSDRMLVHIKGAKGKKDRITILPETLLESLRTYFMTYQPKDYLFENKYGQQLTVRSVQAIFKKALRSINRYKNVGVHSLRHSFATHLMESGTDVSVIQQLLGHNNISTTLVYTHVSKKTILKVKSPLDQIQ